MRCAELRTRSRCAELHAQRGGVRTPSIYSSPLLLRRRVRVRLRLRLLRLLRLLRRLRLLRLLLPMRRAIHKPRPTSNRTRRPTPRHGTLLITPL